MRMVLTGSIGQESMTLRCELAKSESGDLDSLKQRLIQSVRDVTKLRAGVEFIDLNALPQDGLVIEDARSYD